MMSIIDDYYQDNENKDYQISRQSSENDDLTIDYQEANSPIITETVINESSIEIGKKIGSGSYAIVFEGVLNKTYQVAVKEEIHVGSSKEIEKRNEEIKKEVEVMKPLIHQNLIRYIGYCPRQNKITLMLMELGAIDLRKYIDNFKGEIPFKIKINWWLQSSEGLNFLHTNEKIHKDFKAENILFDINPVNYGQMRKSKIKIIDLSHTNGSPSHMSPEAFNGEYSIKSDIFSLGRLGWELFTQKNLSKMYPNKNNFIFKVILQKSNLELPNDLDARVKDLINSCCNFDPDLRPKLGEIIKMLKEIDSELEHEFDDLINFDQEFIQNKEEFLEYDNMELDYDTENIEIDYDDEYDDDDDFDDTGYFDDPRNQLDFDAYEQTMSIPSLLFNDNL